MLLATDRFTLPAQEGTPAGVLPPEPLQSGRTFWTSPELDDNLLPALVISLLSTSLHWSIENLSQSCGS